VTTGQAHGFAKRDGCCINGERLEELEFTLRVPLQKGELGLLLGGRLSVLRPLTVLCIVTAGTQKCQWDTPEEQGGDFNSVL